MTQTKQNSWIIIIIITAFLSYVVTDLTGCLKAKSQEYIILPKKVKELEEWNESHEKDYNDLKAELTETKEASINSHSATVSTKEAVDRLEENVDLIMEYVLKNK